MSEYGRWNDEKKLDAHPEAYQALVNLGKAAVTYLERRGGRKKMPREKAMRRFHLWLTTAKL